MTVSRPASRFVSLSIAVNGPMSRSFFARDLTSSNSKVCLVRRRICSWLMIWRMSLLHVSIRASIAASLMVIPSSWAILSMRLSIWTLVGLTKGRSMV